MLDHKQPEIFLCAKLTYGDRQIWLDFRFYLRYVGHRRLSVTRLAGDFLNFLHSALDDLDLKFAASFRKKLSRTEEIEPLLLGEEEMILLARVAVVIRAAGPLPVVIERNLA